MRFLLVYIGALVVVGMGGLDTAERAFAARSVEIIRTAP